MRIQKLGFAVPITCCFANSDDIRQPVEAKIQTETVERKRQRLKRIYACTWICMCSEQTVIAYICSDIEYDSGLPCEQVKDSCRFWLVSSPAMPEELVRDPVISFRPCPKHAAVRQHNLNMTN